jgi:hypothetical protein
LSGCALGRPCVLPARSLECRFDCAHLRALESCGTFEPAGLKSSRNDYAQRPGPAVPAIRRHSIPWSFCIYLLIRASTPFSLREMRNRVSLKRSAPFVWTGRQNSEVSVTFSGMVIVRLIFVLTCFLEGNFSTSDCCLKVSGVCPFVEKQ